MEQNQMNERVDALTKAFEQIKDFDGIDFSDNNTLFLEFKKKRESTESSALASIYAFLEQILSMEIHPDKKHVYVYTASMFAQFCSLYAIIPESISETGLSVLKYCLPEVNNSFIKARIADILWIREHHQQYAKEAISAYEKLMNETGKHWHEIDEFAGRIVYIGRRSNQLEAVDRVADFLQNRIMQSNQCISEILWSCTYLFSWKDLKNRNTLYLRMIELLEESLATKDISSVGNLEKTLDVVRNIDKRKFEELCGLFSDTLVRLGDGIAKRNCLAAGRFYDMAMDYLNKCSNRGGVLDGKKVEIAQKRQQVRSMDERDYTKISEEYDLSKENERAMGVIESSKDKWDAMIMFAAASSFTKDDLKRHVAESKEWVEKYAFLYQGCCRHNVDEFGVAYKCENSGDAASYDKMKLEIEIRSTAFLIPMLKKITEKYTYDEDEVLKFVNALPGIPPENKTLLYIGLYRCLQGRYFEAVHLLSPFFEGYIRRKLLDKQCSISQLKKNGEDQVSSFGSLVEKNKDDFIELFGEENFFMMNVLFTNPLGANLRNRIAHGNMFPNTKLMRYCVFALSFVVRLILQTEEFKKNDE